MYDVGIIKKIGNKFKLVQALKIRNKGFEDKHKHTRKGDAGNITKIESSISRTKTMVYELSMCNEWTYFATLTLRENEKRDRFDLKKSQKDLSTYIKNYNRLHNCNIQYLLIPEKHKNGAWHFHALINGIPLERLSLFTTDMHLPIQLLNKLKSGAHVYEWLDYSIKFGFCSIERIKSNEAVSKYIMKYITKELERTVTDLNAHMYYASHGLNRAKEVYRGKSIEKIEHPDFENTFVTVKTFDNIEDCYRYVPRV